VSPGAARRYRILVCDDEPAVLRALVVALESHGYAVIATATGEAAVAHAAAEPPDVVLLDLGLPGIDGRETIRRLRSFLVKTPIIVLSAWGEDETKVEALDLGADDYVEKPFAMPELLARIRVAIRHLQRSGGASVESSHLERGDIVLDLAERRVRVRGTEVQLTRTQFDLLAAFARHPGRVLTHRALVSEVWGDPDAADPSNLRVFISQLRRLIEPDPAHPQRIETAPGVGYRFMPGGD
jgi:two-component system KDP operon response regulator KdpE